jgi:tetratricopeptide (TPR) repeat protein
MSDKASIIKEAQKYLARGQVDKAIAEWEKLVREYPDGTTFNTIGDLYHKKGEKGSAIDSFHKAAGFFRQEGFALKALALYKKILNLSPTDAESLIALGELNEAKGLITDAIKFYLAAADSIAKEGNKARLLEIYEKIIALSPSNVPLRSKVAEIYAREGLISEAAKQYLYIAKLYAEKGDTEKSTDFYHRVLEAQPVNREAIMDLNSLYEKTGNLERAIDQMKEAAGLFPQDTDIILRSAELCMSAVRFQEARNYLEQAIEIEPANIKAKRMLGDVYVREGNREKAWAEYLTILDEMLLEENYDDAVRLLSSFRDIDPVETGKRLVSLYTQLGDYSQVIHELTTLGEVFIERDRKKEALNCFKEALKMSPDDESMKTRVVELEKEIGKEQIPISEEKTVEEAILEADIYLRYGLHDNARNLLEGFREQYPENIDLHIRLKSLYTDTGDKEQAVSECLILKELYSKSRDFAGSEQMIKEAQQINAEDPRLAGMAAPVVSETAEEAAATPSEGLSIEDYSEEIAEADFYARQGLFEEAREILERLQNLFPDSAEISQKLLSVGQVGTGELRKEHVEQMPIESETSEVEMLEIEEIAEPALDSDVLDIFNEFKKGLEKELEAEDYETHYNLGIAYKEMGLIDDAIREFQTSRNDPKRFIHSSNMLGVCYIEKGLYPLAIDVLKGALEKMEDQGEANWAMKYELAEAYEKNGDLKEGLDLYMQIYGWNSKFRAVSDKINQLRTQIVDIDEQKKPKERKDRVSYL